MNLTRVLSAKLWLPLLTHPPYPFRCELCNGLGLMVRTDADASIGCRCLVCRGTVFHRGMFKVIRELFGQRLERLRNGSVYEISAHGALFNALKRHAATAEYAFVGSELFDEGTPGQIYNGVRCENVEALTFPDQSFDLITSSNMMEHVENDAAAYQEISRVLKPGGYYIFTIPYYPNLPRTRMLAKRRSDGSIEYLAEPEYHADPFRGYQVFTWRHYGVDLVDILAGAGLRGEVRRVDVAGFQGFPVVLAQRPL